MERFGPSPDSTNEHGYETERLIIDLPEDADVDRLFTLVGGADRRAICSTLGWDGPDDRTEMVHWVERCRESTYEQWGFHWVVRDRTGIVTGEPRQVLGAIGTRPLGVPGRGDVGYWLGRPFWQQGLMSEALTGLVELSASDLGYAKLEAEVFAHNVAGRRLAERAGFELEGIVRRSCRKYGEWVDQAIYGLLI